MCSQGYILFSSRGDVGTDLKRFRWDIEKQVIRLLILMQTVGVKDLRYMTAALPIAGQVEQAGDEAIEIAHTMLQMSPLPVDRLRDVKAQKGLPAEVDDGSTEEPLHITEKVILRGLLDLGREALHMLQEAMRAFDRTDSKVARDVEEEWEYLELRHQRVSQDLMSVLARTYSTIPAVQSGPYMLHNSTQLFWIAQKLKQFADHAKKICKRVIYIVEGESSIP